MGLWKKLFGGAEGCREAMRDSYEKHVRLARQGRIPPDATPHTVGLYGALGSRYRVRGAPIVEVVIWGELAPFLDMNETESVEALAEYIVFQERPQDARVTWLKEKINSALQSCSDESRKTLARIGLMNQVAWCALLGPNTRKAIEGVLERHDET